MACIDFTVGGNAISTSNAGALALFSTPFSRLKVSTGMTLFSTMFRYDRGLVQWEEKTTGGGSVTGPTRSYITLSTTGAGRAVRQTHQYFVYIPGKTQTILISGVLHMENPPTGAIFRIGSYDSVADKAGSADADEANGHFFEASTVSGNTVYSVVQRSAASGSVVDERIERKNWNVDPLDGTGQSKIVVDFTKANVFIIERPWLGVGTVKMNILYGGMLITCHSFPNESIVTTPYMVTATLPIRYEIDGTAMTSGTATLRQICSTVQVENGFDPVGLQLAYSDSVAVANNSTRAMFAFRVNPLYPRIILSIKSFNISSFNTGSGTIFIDIYYGNKSVPITISGGSWGAASTGSVYTERNTLLTSFTGGRLINSIPLVGTTTQTQFTSFDSLLAITTDMSGLVPDVFAVQARSSGTVNGSTVSFTIMWTELM
jgi:hypothetical protein